MSDTVANIQPPNNGASSTAQAPPPVSIFRKRLRKFKTLKRGYYSFIFLVALYVLSWVALPLLVNKNAIIVHYKGELFFPLLNYYPGSTFGQLDSATGKPSESEADYRVLGAQLSRSDDGWCVMPPYQWDPYESDYNTGETPPAPPSSTHWLGTDDTFRDVFARMCYGFRVSMSFALALTLLEFLIGGTIGSLMGYFGGKLDLFGQRIVEIWSNIPFLYTVIIVSSLIQPSFLLLIIILAAFDWVVISYLMRGEFYREKGKDYVAAAIALGATNTQIIFRHILPNSLTPLISRLPFAMVSAIFALVSLDYLGFGIPPPSPSWGQMVGVGLQNIDAWWLVLFPLSAMFTTLLLITFIGEAIREAFDPRVYSRLR